MPELLCASDTVRAFLVDEARKSKATSGEIAYLQEVQACDDGASLHVVVAKGKKQKRPLSKYNLFIKDCATGGEKTLGECAGEWRRQTAT